MLPSPPSSASAPSAPLTASALLKADAAERVRSGSSVGGRQRGNAAVVPVSSPLPPANVSSPSPSSSLPASSSSPSVPAPFDRVGRLRRLLSMCASSADGSTSVSSSELLVTLSYLSRSLRSDESEGVHRLLEESDHSTGLPMKAFHLLLTDCLHREEGEKEATQGGLKKEEEEEEGHRRFVSFVLERLRLRLMEAAASTAVEVRGTLDAAAEEVAGVKRRLRLAEQGSRLLAEKVERLTCHLRRVEDDNGRLAALSVSAVREQSSEAEVAQSLTASLDQSKATAARLSSALTASEAQLARERAELQHAMAVLQMERAGKVAQSQELMLLREQVTALQAGRSSELRQVLKRKKEAMAAIMDSHRYTRDLKRQSERVPALEADLQQAKALIAKQADDICEYQQLLAAWKGGLDTLPVTRARPAFSLCDDLDIDDGGGAGELSSASRGHSRRPSGAEFTAAVHRLSRRSSGISPAVEQLAVLKVEMAAAEQSLTELKGHRDALLLSQAAVSAEKEELEQRVEAQSVQLRTQTAELQLREELITGQQREGEEQRRQWREEEAAVQLQQQRRQCQLDDLHLRLEQLQAALSRTTADRDAALADLAAARKALEASEAARLALQSSSSSQDVSQQQQVAALKAEVTSLTGQLSASQSALQRCQLLYQPAMEEVEAAGRRERQWQAERAELQAEAERLRAELQALQAKVDSHVCPSLPPTVTVGGCQCGRSLVASSEGGRALHLDAPVQSQKEAEVLSTPSPAVALLVQPLPPSSAPSVPSPVPWPVIALSSSQQVEVDCFVRYINRQLAGDEDVAHLLPLREGSSELLAKVRDGLLLAKLLNASHPSLIDVRALNRRPPSSASTALTWQAVVQNLNLVISAAKAVGLTMRQQRRASGLRGSVLPSSSTSAAFTPLAVEEDDGSGDDFSSTAPFTRAAASTVLISQQTASTLGPSDFARGGGRERSATSVSSGGGGAEVGGRPRAESSVSSMEGDDGGGEAAPRPSIGSPAPLASSSRALDVSSSALQLMEATQPELVLDFVYQIIRSAVCSPLDVHREPRLHCLAAVQPAIPSAALPTLTAEKLLDRWLRFILGDTPGVGQPLTDDLGDGRVYHALMDRLQPQTRRTSESGAAEASPHPLSSFLPRLDDIGVRHFHSDAALSASHSRLRVLLFACIFDHCHGLPAYEPSTVLSFSSAASSASALQLGGGSAVLSAEVEEGSREERAFRMWMNSAGIEGVYVHSLVADCRDGLVLLRLIDWVERGSVDWKAVELQPNNKFKAVSNCNLALRLCKERLHASLVGIGGEDIHDGSQKLILAVIWQLVRYNAIKKLEIIRQHNRGGGSSRRLTDGDILIWANSAVESLSHPVCVARHSSRLRSWRDSTCTTALFLLNLLHTLNPAVVDWTQVATGVDGSVCDNDPTLGLSVSNRLSNALYAISVARKLGAEAFLMPEDIVECKPKMILLFIGSCMQIHQEQEQQQRG